MSDTQINKTGFSASHSTSPETTSIPDDFSDLSGISEKDLERLRECINGGILLGFMKITPRRAHYILAKESDLVFEGISRYLQQKNLKTSVFDSEYRFIMLPFKITASSYQAVICVDDYLSMIAFSVYMPIRVSNSYRLVVQSLLGDINTSLSYGCFYLDSHGGVLFRSSYSYAEQAFNASVFERYLTNALLLSDRHFEDIASIAAGTLTEAQKNSFKEAVRLFFRDQSVS